MSVSVLRAFFADVFMPVADRVSDGLNVYELWTRGDQNWAIATIALIALPGICEILYWTVAACRNEGVKWTTAVFWIVGFGIFFPISATLWYIVQFFRTWCCADGLSKQRAAQSLVLKSLQAFTESAGQLQLQLFILFTTYKPTEMYLFQILSALGSWAMLASSTSEHHFFEISAKERTSNMREFASGFFFFLFHIGCRGVAVAFLASYLRAWIFVLLAVLVASNYVTAHFLLRTYASKNVWTAFASVLVPTCFVSRDTVVEYTGSPGKRFLRYDLVNSAVFWVLTSLAMGVLHASFEYFPLKYTCSHLPVFSCAVPGSPDAACAFRRTCQEIENPHDRAVVLGWVLVAGLGAVSVFTQALRRICCSVLEGHYVPVEPAK